MEAEPGGVQLQAKKHQGWLVAAVRQAEAGKDPFLEALPTLDRRHLASRNKLLRE